MSADTTVIFAVAMDRERVSSFGPGFGFSTAWADDFVEIVTADLATQSLKVGDHIIADQFQKVARRRFPA